TELAWRLLMNGFEMILPFLKPIEHLILDDTITEVMVNGSKRVFIGVDGVTLTIRKFNSAKFTVNNLIEAGTLERWQVNQLKDCVLRRANILISGGTGTGKTTLLNILGKFIPEDERILVIDDTSEIRIEHNNAVRLKARQAQDGLPAVTICELLKAALR